MSDSAPAAPGPPGPAGTGPIADPTGAPGFPGGGFRVETDAAATPVARLDEALERLTGTLAWLRRYQILEAPAEDHESQRIADNNRRMLGNAHDYVLVLRNRVEAARDALRAQIDSYARVDDPRMFRR